MKAEDLTNESLQGICGSSFDLAHYAMALGKYHMRSGKEVSLKDILKEVKKYPSKSHLEDLKQLDEFDRNEGRDP